MREMRWGGGNCKPLRLQDLEEMDWEDLDAGRLQPLPACPVLHIAVLRSYPWGAKPQFHSSSGTFKGTCRSLWPCSPASGSLPARILNWTDW